MTEGGDEGRWWRWEVVTMGSGEEGKWWRWEVMMKGSGEEGRWGRWEVVRKGSGQSEVVMMGSGDNGKWLGRELVTKASGELGRKPEHETLCFSVSSGCSRRWKVPLCSATSGCVYVCSSMRDLKLWLQIALEWLHECCMGIVLGRKPGHETLCFSVQSGCSRRWKVPRLCGGCGCGRFAFFFLPQCNGGLKLLWVCLCVRSYRVF